YNNDVIVVTLNMFPTSGGTEHVQVDAIDVASLIAPTPKFVVNHQDVYDPVNLDINLRPVVMHDAKAGDPMWFVKETGDGANLTLVRMDNPDNPLTTTFTSFQVPVNPYDDASSVDVGGPADPGGTITTNIDSRIIKAAEANDTIVASHAVSNFGVDDRLLAR